MLGEGWASLARTARSHPLVNLRNRLGERFNIFQRLKILHYLMETSMFLTAKLNLITGMVIGATAVLAMKQMCNQHRKQKRSSTPNDTPQE